jgi:putative oxidoreductase
MLKTYDRAAHALGRAAPALLPLIARLSFATVLLFYFWSSAKTKIGMGLAGLFEPTDGAYAQIFPRAFETAGYDVSQLGFFHWVVAVAGLWSELLLPFCIAVGLFTRLSAAAMIGFILVQSLTDVYGHGVGGDDLGRWFDAASGALILDQRTLWVSLLLTLVFLGGGALSLDGILHRWRPMSALTRQS